MLITIERTVDQLLDCDGCTQGAVVEIFNPTQLVSGSSFFQANITECCPTYTYNKDCCNNVISKTPSGTKITLEFDDSILAEGVLPADLDLKTVCCKDACFRFLAENVVGIGYERIAACDLGYFAPGP